MINLTTFNEETESPKNPEYPDVYYSGCLDCPVVFRFERRNCEHSGYHVKPPLEIEFTEGNPCESCFDQYQDLMAFRAVIQDTDMVLAFEAEVVEAFRDGTIV